MKSYADIKAQISRLEKEASLARQKELNEVVASIREKMEVYGLTIADLGLKGGRAKGKLGAKRPAGVPKYRDPKSGKTWTGHGKPPNWISGSKNRDVFLIGGEPTPAAAASKKAAAPAASPDKEPAKKAAAEKPSRKVAAKKAPAKKAAAKKAADKPQESAPVAA